MSLVTNLKVQLSADYKGSNDLGTPEFPLNYTSLINMASGTGASQSDLLFPDVSGWAVTAGTGDLITVTNSAGGTTVDYDIILIGTSA